MQLETTLQSLRAQIRAELKKPLPQQPTERRVYQIPERTVRGILAYQLAHRLPSEAEAARRLIDEALSAWEAALIERDRALITREGDSRSGGACDGRKIENTMDG